MRELRLDLILLEWRSTRRRFIIKAQSYILLLVLLLTACEQKNKSVSETIPEGGYKRVVVDATVYRGLMQMLGVSDRCIDFSHEMNPNVEEIAAQHPDLIMLSAYQGRDLSKYRKLGIRIIECRDFEEPSALKRLEWIKYFGRLWGANEKADSLYNVVVKYYNRVKHSTPLPITGKGSGKGALFDLPYGGQWYQPGPHSTTGSLIADAGGKVLDAASSKEQILSYDPDIWIIRYSGKSPLTLKQLGEMDPFYRQLRPFKEGEVYVCYAAENNYYDETPWRPDLLLQDFQKIISGKPAQLRYFEKLRN